LAEKHLPLTVTQLLLDLGFDVLLRVQHGHLPLDVQQHRAEPLLHRQGLEQLLGFGVLQVEMTRHEIGKATGFLCLCEKLLHGLLGHAGTTAQFCRPLAGLSVEGCKSGRIRIDRRHLVGHPNRRHEKLVLLVVTHRDPTVQAVQQ
jgi:hypothetical protein